MLEKEMELVERHVDLVGSESLVRAVKKIKTFVLGKRKKSDKEPCPKMCPVHGNSLEQDENCKWYCVNADCTYPMFNADQLSFVHGEKLK